MNSYDVIVIDENLSSLMTACLLQHRGMRTLLLKKSRSDLGRLCETMYYWDPEGGALGVALKKLGISFTKTGWRDTFTDRLLSDDICFQRTTDWDEYRQDLCSLFPECTVEITELFQNMEAVAKEWIRLLDAGSVFQAGSLKNMMKFRNLSYRDYISETVSNKRLRKLLMLDCDKSDAAFVVISGYVFSQILDGYQVQDIDLVYQLLESNFIGNGGTIRPAYEIIGITKKEQFFCLKGSEDQEDWCSYLVSPYSDDFTMEKFFGTRRKSDCRNQIYVQYLVIHTPDNKETITEKTTRDKLYSQIENTCCILNVLKTPDHMVIKISSAEKVSVDEKFLSLLFSLYGLKDNSKVKIYEDQELEAELGISAYDSQKWEFSPEQLQHNMMDMTSSVDGMFALGEWGCAYFTAALCASNTIMLRRQRSDKL